MITRKEECPPAKCVNVMLCLFQARSHEEEKKEQLDAAVLRLEVLKVSQSSHLLC